MKKRTRAQERGGLKGKYGVIVVGAGIGGLSVAALLAKRGMDVLVLDQSETAGGCCRSFARDGYTFDAGASLFLGMGGKTRFNFLQNVFDELGAAPDWKMLNPSFDISLPDQTFHAAHERRSFVRQLAGAFPHDAKGLKRLYAELHDLYEVLGDLPRYHAMGRWTLLKICALHPWFAQKLLTAAPRSLEDLYAKHLHDERLIAVFESLVAVLTLLDNTELPALVAALLLMEPHEGGVWYPMGGSGAVAATLLSALEKAGGDFAPRSRVDEVIIGGGRARGVRLGDGTEIHAERVISNASKEQTFGRLVDMIYVSDGLRKQVAYQENADSFFGVFLGVDATAVPEGLAVHTIVSPRYAPRWREAPPVVVSIPSLVDPSLAPAGGHAVTLISPERVHGWERNRYYEERKAAYAREKIALAERIIPGLSKAVRVMETASPLTYERFTMRPGGTFGIRMDHRQGLLNRLGNKTELPNLYCVGDSTFPGSGVFSVAYSGMMCANLICRETGRRYPGEDD
ncbi:MAG: NAD(P)/FAD-dependent oxidoreductase [Deltaproteobacteria bacterium]|nr:NAD(P)/FAD-dependent oxidoreductase [Deltaproteobacteria bacterium]